MKTRRQCELMCVDVLIDVVRLFGIRFENCGIPDWVFRDRSRSMHKKIRYQDLTVYLKNYEYLPPGALTDVANKKTEYNIFYAVKKSFIKKPSGGVYIVLGTFLGLAFWKFGLLATFIAYLAHWTLHLTTKAISDSRANVKFYDPKPATHH